MEECQACNDQMGVACFMPSTRKTYGRALRKFVGRLHGCPLRDVTVSQVKRYLSELKRSGASKTAYSTTRAALRFYMEKVRRVEWEPVSALRRRMLDDMALAGFAERTQSSYVRSVLGLAKHYRRSPDAITEEEIRQYFVYMTCKRKLARPTVTIALCGIKYFYEKTLRRDWSLTGVPVPKRKKTLPVVLTKKEVYAILSNVINQRHRTCLALIYACGLRLSEGCRIETRDIDRARKLLHVRGGKGAKDRYVPLPEVVFPVLEGCWLLHKNPVFMFPWMGRSSRHCTSADRHVPIQTIQKAFREALIASGVKKVVSVHSLRHGYATHLLEARVPMRQLQMWLGHGSSAVTERYAHVTEEITQSAAKTSGDVMGDLGDFV